MPQTRMNCPKCHQPITANIEQLFDNDIDTQAKQRLLSGYFNVAHCANCGYEGNLATPLVYHDSEKQLLLTFFPPELMIPVNEQEKLIGPLINQVVNRLPPEKRKAYILTPKTMLTLQQLIETILEADGITREMLEAQQQRVQLLQNLMQTPEESWTEIVQKEDALMDESFFGILNRLIEASLASGDEKSAVQLSNLQDKLLPLSTKGRELKERSDQAENAVKTLKAAIQKGLSRESLLDLLVATPNEIQLQTMVTLARTGLDYQFFQVLAERIEKATGEQKEELVQLREYLLKLTQELDQQMQAHVQVTRQNLETLLQAKDIEQATLQNLQSIDNVFVSVLDEELQAAREKGDLERAAKLQQVFSVLEKANTPPPEVKLVEDLLSAKDESERKAIFDANKEKITDEFVQILSSLVTQSQAQGQDQDTAERLQEIYKEVLRFKMQANLQNPN